MNLLVKILGSLGGADQKESDIHLCEKVIRADCMQPALICSNFSLQQQNSTWLR